MSACVCTQLDSARVAGEATADARAAQAVAAAAASGELVPRSHVDLMRRDAESQARSREVES